MNYCEIMSQEISVKMKREQLTIIRAAFSLWLDRQENLTDEFIQIENMLNEYFPAIKGERKAN